MLKGKKFDAFTLSLADKSLFKGFECPFKGSECPFKGFERNFCKLKKTFLLLKEKISPVVKLCFNDFS